MFLKSRFFWPFLIITYSIYSLLKNPVASINFPIHSTTSAINFDGEKISQSIHDHSIHVILQHKFSIFSFNYPVEPSHSIILQRFYQTSTVLLRFPIKPSIDTFHQNIDFSSGPSRRKNINSFRQTKSIIIVIKRSFPADFSPYGLDSNYFSLVRKL